MKIIKLYVLSLLFVGSFNVLGAECKVKNKDSTYEITSSVYSNNTKIGTCKCKAGYEFKINPPLPMGVLLVAGKDNLFTEPSGLNIYRVPSKNSAQFNNDFSPKNSLNSWIFSSFLNKKALFSAFLKSH
jgi:hypothetical protein